MQLMSHSLDTLLLMCFHRGCRACLKPEYIKTAELHVSSLVPRFSNAVMQFVAHIEMSEINALTSAMADAVVVSIAKGLTR